MKRVFSNTYECFHIFAQQSQYEGRASSVSFHNNKAYSYSQCIGNIEGDNIFLINWNYSVTTGKHNSELRSATSHFNQIYIKYPDCPNDESNIRDFERQSQILIDKLTRAKKPEIYLNEFSVLQSEISKYLLALPKLSKPFKNRLNKIVKADLNKDNLIEVAKKRIEAEERAKQKMLKSQIKDFRNFDREYIHNSELTYLRANGETIETSKGVKVEKSKILPLIEIYKRFLETKNESLKNALIGRHIDSYSINKVCDKFVSIGCHKITASEILSVA